MRAALINTTVYETKTPSFASQGFGRVNISAFVDNFPNGLTSIVVSESPNDAITETGQERHYDQIIPAQLSNVPDAYLCTSISWTDPPSFANSKRVLGTYFFLRLLSLSSEPTVH